MSKRTNNIFTTIRTEGAILPTDLLQRISSRDNSLDGITTESYHLVGGERFNEAINRSWNRLMGAWLSFKNAQDKLNESERGTRITREKWLLILFEELHYGRLQFTKAQELEGRSYPISHVWNNTPIHLVGFKIDMDKRESGVAGAARTSPHSLVQEFLNQSDDHLWGIVSNGHRLRILRDNVSLTRQAYVEFDLEGMMDGEVYSDFALLWLLCHQSRVESERPETCWLETWSKIAKEQGTRALETLRDGVENAIKSLGRGLISNNENLYLKDKLRSGELSTQDLYRQILRIVYRIIFLLVAEDRDLLSKPDVKSEIKELYYKYYSVTRLRQLAEKRRGANHTDLWIGLNLVFEKLGNKDGCEELGLSPLGSFLWSEDAIEDIASSKLINYELLEAIRSLTSTIDNNVRRFIDYKNMGSEELGSVYESLLEMHPDLNIDAGTFELKTSGGNERKSTGAYYTPDSLVQCLLDSALDPVIEQAIKKENPEKAILNLKVCDPACGSGHFLIAAAHRLAKRLAAIRTGDEEPSPVATRQALREVVGRCLYGVDINPMAVELCKVSLWMEALEPGKPLSFLEHHIQCGNSLLGTNPALMTKGIPDEAFKAIEGDDKEYCTRYKRINKNERETLQKSLFDRDQMPWDKLGDLPTSIAKVDTIDDNTLDGIEKKYKKYSDYVKSSEYLNQRFLADIWCASFIWKKLPESKGGFAFPITEDVFRNIEKNPHSAPNWLKEEVVSLTKQYQFFHWHISYPDVFNISVDISSDESAIGGWAGGFDCILGNPPWERTALEELEYFANRSNEVLAAPTTSRRKEVIKQLKSNDSLLYKEFKAAKNKANRITTFASLSGRYPLGAFGRLNTYALFADLGISLINSSGRAGLVVQTGIAVDAPMETFWQYLIDNNRLVSLIDFENKKPIFVGVHREQKFCLLTVTGSSRSKKDPISVGFWLDDLDQLFDPDRIYNLPLSSLSTISPNTRQPLLSRYRIDGQLAYYIYNNSTICSDNNKDEKHAFAWVAMTSASFSEYFRLESDFDIYNYAERWKLYSEKEYYFPLIESKMIHQFDYSYATYDKTSVDELRNGNPIKRIKKKNNIEVLPKPRLWAKSSIVEEFLDKKNNKGDWLYTYRDVTNVNNERTTIAAVLPKVGLLQPLNGIHIEKDPCHILAALNSFVCDYISRQRFAGRHLNVTTFNQLPIPINKNNQFVVSRVIELTYTGYDLASWALSQDYDGHPFLWDEFRRFIIRCELDAFYFYLYLGSEKEWDVNCPEDLKNIITTPRMAISHIMDSFSTLKRRDISIYSEYKTCEVILRIYDEMTEAIKSGNPYISKLDPLPGPPLNPEGNFAVFPDWPEGTPRPTNWPSHIHEPKRK